MTLKNYKALFQWMVKLQTSVTTDQTLKKLNESPIIVNLNPETVFTDYNVFEKL